MVNAGPVLTAVSFQPYSDSSVEKRKKRVVFSNFTFFSTPGKLFILFSILFPIDLITLINWTN